MDSWNECNMYAMQLLSVHHQATLQVARCTVEQYRSILCTVATRKYELTRKDRPSTSTPRTRDAQISYAYVKIARLG